MPRGHSGRRHRSDDSAMVLPEDTVQLLHYLRDNFRAGGGSGHGRNDRLARYLAALWLGGWSTPVLAKAVGLHRARAHYVALRYHREHPDDTYEDLHVPEVTPINPDGKWAEDLARGARLP